MHYAYVAYSLGILVVSRFWVGSQLSKTKEQGQCLNNDTVLWLGYKIVDNADMNRKPLYHGLYE